MKVLDFELVADRTTDMQEPGLTAKARSPECPPIWRRSWRWETRPWMGADIYALGCVAYWLLTRIVFETDSPLQMVLQHIEAPPIAPSRRGGVTILTDLEELILWCLQKKPDQRPADVEGGAPIRRLPARSALDGGARPRLVDENIGPAADDRRLARHGARASRYAAVAAGTT